MNTFFALLVRLLYLLACLVCLHLARGEDYLVPGDVVLRSDKAAQETLEQSTGAATLRFLGLDIFPRAAVTAMYDDNLLIAHSNQLRDVEWTISPGVTVAAGDVSLYQPGSVTLGQIRNLLNQSLLDDSPKPERYLGVDYAPAVNRFTDHSQYDNVDQTAGLSAGYDFARVAIGADLDFSRLEVKDNDIGSLVTREQIDTKLRSRYEVTDRSAFEINALYRQLTYANNIFQGYEEFRNEDWFDRKVGARLEIDSGIALGFVHPQLSPDQTYQQALLRASYLLTGKLDVRARAGVEWRHYGARQSDTLDPVFSLEAVYQPRLSTTFSLEGHQRSEPSFGADYNYEIVGFSAGVQQQVGGQIYMELSGNYEHVDYVRLNSGPSNNRADGYFAVRANLGYEFNRHLKGTLFYDRRQDDSNIPQFTYANNMAGVRVAWRY